jgi:hypothetical protein
MMKKTLASVLALAQLVALLLALPAHAGTIRGISQEITCPATGTSITVLAQNIRRGQFAILNESGTDVRIGYLRAELGTPALTTANSILFKTGLTLTDDGDTVYIGRIVCMSTTASPVNVGLHWADR